MAKPHKVEEPTGVYHVGKPSRARTKKVDQKAGQAPVIRYVDDATFRKAADKVFKVHSELLRKLAQ